MNKYNYFTCLLCFLCQYSFGQEIYLPTTHPIYTGYELHTPCVADFDGDGLDELAVTVKPVGAIQIFDVTPTGELVRQQLISSINWSEKPIATDMDGDGDLDLICSIFPHKIGWYENEGNSHFSTNQNIIYEGYNLNLESSDFDSDGDTDILFSSYTTLVLLSNENGVFSPHQTFDEEAYSQPFVIDFDADGDLDFLNFNENHIVNFFNNENGVFSKTELSIPIDIDLDAIAAGDLDNDGDIDLGFIAKYNNTLYVAYNAGDGVDFSDTLSIIYTPDYAPAEEINFFDIDNDDLLDIVIGGYYRTNGPAWFKNENTTFTAQFEDNTSFYYIQHFLPMEIDGDEEIEAIAISQAANIAHTYDFDSLQNKLINLNHFQSITYFLKQTIFADMDADGDQDVVSFSDYKNNIYWHETGISDEDEAAHLISSNQQNTSHTYSIYGQSVVGDVNGDGFPDVIVTDNVYLGETYLYLNQPNSNDFSDGIPIVSEVTENSILFDADNDGDLDFAFSDNKKDDYFLAENIDGLGTFATPVVIHEQRKRVNSPVATNDMDNDGDLDLVLFSIPKDDIFIRQLVVLENEAAFNFTNPTILLDSLSTNGRHDVSWKDMNGDGFPDVIYKKASHSYNTAPVEIGIIYNLNGTGLFSNPVIIANEAPGNGHFRNFERLNIEDIDNDGDLDIYVLSNKWYENLDNSGDFLPHDLTVPAYYSDVRGFADFDADGDLDFLFGSKNALAWVENIATHKYWLNGHLTADTIENCTTDINEFPLKNWKIVAEGATYSSTGLTDSLGYYHLPIDSGEWIVNAIPISPLWLPCFEDSLLVMPPAGDTLTTDFFMQPNGDCAYLDWSTTSPRLRACQSNTFTLDLCNYGVMTGEDIVVEVVFDSLLYFESASLPHTVDADSSYFFDIGSLDINECISLTIDAFLDCDSASLFQLQCVEFKIHPEEICVPENSAWDGALIHADGVCVGDSIYFTLENIGTGSMVTPSQFRVEIINDDIVMLLLTDTFQLGINEEIALAYPRQGLGMRLSADQTFDNPFNVETSVIVPNCEDIANNIVLEWMPNNNGNPFAELICNAVFGSYDPNDKNAVPKGVGNEHLIEKDWELDYTIRFQNTGNDTAFLVVLRDTLDENLDLTTLNLRGSSHAYEYELNAGRELKITFENILLPDSTTNLAESQGFVSYTILPKSDILTGTIIENTAGIYFDFNPPIITNTTVHKIRRPVVASSEHITVCQDDFFTNDTILREEIALLEYDSIHFTHVEVLPLAVAQNTVITAVETGSIFAGVLIENDTLFTQVFVAQNGCDSLVHFEISILNNTTAAVFQHLEIFPNPVNDYLTILNNHQQEAQHWRLITVTGQTVWQADFTKNEPLQKVDMQGFSTGVYYLEVRTATGIGIWKVLKE